MHKRMQSRAPDNPYTALQSYAIFSLNYIVLFPFYCSRKPGFPPVQPRSAAVISELRNPLA